MRIASPADLARLVKTQRQARGLTQHKVADRVGITRQSLARIESGSAAASFATILRLLDALGVDLTANRQVGGNDPTTHAAPPLHNSDAFAALRRAVEAQDPDLRAKPQTRRDRGN